jgi:hypothetical protein
MDTTMLQNQIRENMMVHAQGSGSMRGVAGDHVGMVDYLEGDSIVLTKNDSPDGQHHSIPLTMVERVEGNTVFLNCDVNTVHEQWDTVEKNPQLDR